MFTALFCVLMMVAMIWMMVAMPVAHRWRQGSSEPSQDNPPET
jgi:hypothetical protein